MMTALQQALQSQAEIVSDLDSLEPKFVPPTEWDEIAIQFRDVLHEQTECFNALRWAPHQLDRVAFYKNGQLVSAAVILKMRFPIVGGGIAVVKWGPLWRRKGLPNDPKNPSTNN